MTDVSDLNRLAADLTAAGLRAGVRGFAVLEKAGVNIKTGARSLAPHGPYTPQYPRSITYDIGVDGFAIVLEVGPDKNLAQGPLGNLLEYGTAELGPHAHIGPAFDREVPKTVARLTVAGADIL